MGGKLVSVAAAIAAVQGRGERVLIETAVAPLAAAAGAAAFTRSSGERTGSCPENAAHVAVGAHGELAATADADALALVGFHLAAALDGERARAVVDGAPVALYRSKLDGELVELGPAIARITGHPAEAFREPAFLVGLIGKEDRARRAERLAALGDGESASLEYRIEGANGGAWIGELVRRSGSELVGAIANLGDRRKGDERARDEARLLAMGELAAGVAHEINNPLSGVLTYAQLGQRLLATKADPKKLEEPLDAIIAEADRILEITRTLVLFAKRPGGETGFHAAATHELVRAALMVAKQRLKANSIAIDVDVPFDLPMIRARGHELSQVLHGIIDNARVALDARFPRWDPEKRLVLKATRVEPDPEFPAGHVRLVVEDRGVGMSPDDTRRLFSPFSSRRGGAGLTLHLAREILHAHGGRIEVESVPGEGTRCVLLLPCL